MVRTPGHLDLVRPGLYDDGTLGLTTAHYTGTAVTTAPMLLIYEDKHSNSIDIQNVYLIPGKHRL